MGGGVMDTYWPSDLAIREADVCGDTPSSLIERAAIKLLQADGCQAWVARHQIAEAADDLDRAAKLLRGDLAEEAFALSKRCDAALDTIGWPWVCDVAIYA